MRKVLAFAAFSALSSCALLTEILQETFQKPTLTTSAQSESELDKWTASNMPKPSTISDRESRAWTIT